MKFGQEDLRYAYEHGKHIVRGWSVYQVFYGVNTGYYCNKLYTKQDRHGVPLTNRGYWHAMDAKGVNKLLGFELLNEN